LVFLVEILEIFESPVFFGSSFIFVL
jgi:hypothetical protein